MLHDVHVAEKKAPQQVSAATALQLYADPMTSTAVQGGPTYGEKIYCSEISAVQFLDQRF